MSLQPIKNRVVARRINTEEQSAGGIIVAKESGKTTNVGEVAFIGPDVKECAVGDRVIFIDNMTFDYNGESFVTFLDTQILGKIV